jgi:hypothetical protein
VSGTNTTVSVKDSALVASKGGNGSAGGAGGPGGTPTDGKPGANATCPQDNGPNMAPGSGCGCVGKNDKTFSGGAKGGTGSEGGRGGDGSGGAGGDSVSFVTVSGARVLVEGSFGQTQQGGAGLGAGGAQDGRMMESFASP